MTRAAGLHSIGSVPCPLAVARPLAGVRDFAAQTARYPALTKRRVIDYCRIATAL